MNDARAALRALGTLVLAMHGPRRACAPARARRASLAPVRPRPRCAACPPYAPFAPGQQSTGVQMEADDSSRLPLAGVAPGGACAASAAPASDSDSPLIQPNARDAMRRETRVRR
ncbi:conserved hypothetical protein [Burkholderia pseudomallei Pakistan 9]|nr:conserved hypothetical protein [Burkholderia pseudomallei Pakistan 9]